MQFLHLFKTVYTEYNTNHTKLYTPKLIIPTLEIKFYKWNIQMQ